MATILNVDDDGANRYVKTRVLRDAGFDVVEAGTGEDALSIAVEAKPSLVLLDVRLPDINGIEVCRRLRADARTSDIPVIHISATHVTARDEATSLRAGADIYLAEPVGPHELSIAVRTLLRLRATEQGLAATQARLRLATEAAGVATWELEPGSGRAQWSDNFSAMLGLAATASEPSADRWLSSIHAEDRERLGAAFRAAQEGPSGFSEEFRAMVADGGTRWIAAFGRLQPDEGSGPARLVGVALDITTRKEAELEREARLTSAREAQRLAEQAALMKDEFLAVLSHELRTPMSAMLGWLHLLKSGRLTGEEQREALETVERNARVQTQLVNDLLDVSRIITGKMELESVPLPLDRALGAAIESSQPAASARGIQIVPDFQVGEWTILGNAARVQQIFTNLLSNAIKFSPPRGRIAVRLARESTTARVEILDHGEGIAPQVLPHIFERFRQADSSTRRRHGGLGLGLAIVRSLVELHNGQVEAKSNGPGTGACFIVRLPLHSPAAQAPADATVQTGVNLQGLRVLVVDDDASHLKMISKTLRLENASVMTALGHEAAMAVCKRWRPELLVLDIGLPEVDGLELLGKLRELLGAGPAELPAVALSGFAAKEDVARALSAGFQAHMPKPFEIGDLTTLLARLGPSASRNSSGTPSRPS